MINTIYLDEMDIIKEQELELNKQVTIIYGLNNSGKTKLLNQINSVIINNYKDVYFSDQSEQQFTFLPTGRLGSSGYINEIIVSDYEMYLQYNTSKSETINNHISSIRKKFEQNIAVNEFLNEILLHLFDFNEQFNLRNEKKYSDGIENIIAIFVDLVWSVTWKIDITDYSLVQLKELLAKAKIVISIDEIEMYLHATVQEKVVKYITDIFKNSKIILTTHSPLVITRIKDICLLEIKNGLLSERTTSNYYKDLDEIYRNLFNVAILPSDFREDYDYLCNLIDEDVEYNKDKLKQIVERLETEENYNISKLMNIYIYKVKSIYEVL